MSELEVLAAAPLFSGISKNDIPTMLSCLSAKRVDYAREEYILSAGDSVTKVGLVLKGIVNVIKEDFWGNRAILAKAGVGEMFGEAFACAGTEELPISAVASEKTRVLFIDYKKIITTCSSCCAFHTRLIQNMLQILADKNIMLTQKIEHIAKKSIREKLLSYLSEQAAIQGSRSFNIPFNRQELADYLSVDRSALSYELGRMRDGGILNFHKNHFELL